MNIIKEPLALNNFEHHTFLVSITTDCASGSLNLRRLSEEFKVDVSLNKDRTKIKQGSVVIDRSLPICSTRSKNKQIETTNSFGFVKLSYPKDPDIMYYTNPPDIIPMDCYCVFCNNKGPFAHDNYCSNPKKSNLYITLKAYINAIIYGSYKINGILSQYADKLYEIIRNPENGITRGINQEDVYPKILAIVQGLRETDRNLYDNLFSDDEHMKVSLSNILVLTKKDKDGKFFAGPIMLKYKTGSKKVTIRIRKTGNIELISNPWSNREIYKEIIEKINMTSQKVRFIDGDIKSFFSSVNLFVCQNKYLLDLRKVYNYIWPITNTWPKREINKNFYIHTENNNILYKYKINTDKISDNRLYIELERCIIQDNEMINDYYKISVQLFAQGHLQATFGYNDIDYPKKSIDEQFVIIQSLFIEIQKLFLFHISKLIENDPSVIMTKETKNISKKIFETVIGIMPYAKRKKFKINDNLNIFDHKKKEWSTKVWTVKEIFRTTENGKMSEIKYLIQNNKNEEITRTCIHNDLRKVEPNNDQVCRLNENGIQKHPYPYSFYGQCQGGLDHYIPPMGIISRSDNNFYPYTIPVNHDSENWIINFILNGFTQDEMYNGFIKKNKNDKYDSYCGTFIPNTALIGSVIDALIENNIKNVQIIDKYKTHGFGNDNNVVKYKVQSIEDSKEYEITGKQFSHACLENRYFEGLLNMKFIDNLDSIDILIRCAKKLHIIRNDIDSEISKNEKLLSKWNIRELTTSKINSVTVVNEYIEDCVNKVLYIVNNKIKNTDRYTYIYTFNKIEDCDKYIGIYGLFNKSKKIFYPIKLENTEESDDINFANLVEELYTCVDKIDHYENVQFCISCIEFKNIMPFINNSVTYKQYTYKNMPFVIYFNTNNTNNEDTIYKWTSINRNVITVAKSDVNVLKKYLSKEMFDTLNNSFGVDETLSFKPNMMMNGEINHETPFLDIQTVDKNCVCTDINEIDYIFGKLNLTIFKSSVSWKIINQIKIIESEPMTLVEESF